MTSDPIKEEDPGLAAIEHINKLVDELLETRTIIIEGPTGRWKIISDPTGALSSLRFVLKKETNGRWEPTGTNNARFHCPVSKASGTRQISQRDAAFALISQIFVGKRLSGRDVGDVNCGFVMTDGHCRHYSHANTI